MTTVTTTTAVAAAPAATSSSPGSWTLTTDKSEVVVICDGLISKFMHMIKTKPTARIQASDLITRAEQWWARNDAQCHGVAFEREVHQRFSLSDTIWLLLSCLFHADHERSKTMLAANAELAKHTPPRTYVNGTSEHFIGSLLARELRYRVATYHWIIPSEIFFSTECPMATAAEAKRKQGGASSSSSSSDSKKNEKLMEERKQREMDELIFKSSTLYPIIRDAQNNALLALCSAFIVPLCAAVTTTKKNSNNTSDLICYHQVLTLASRLYGVMNLERHLIQQFEHKIQPNELPVQVTAARNVFHNHMIEELKYQLGHEFLTFHYNEVYKLLMPAAASRRYVRLRRENHKGDKLHTKFQNTYTELCYSPDHLDAFLREASEWIHKDPKEIVSDRESVIYDLFASSMFSRSVNNLSKVKSEEYFNHPDEVFDEENLKRLNSYLKFAVPETPYRPVIVVFGRRIYVRDYKTLYICEHLVDAWLMWLFLIHTKYNGRMEQFNISIHDFAVRMFPPPPTTTLPSASSSATSALPPGK